MLPPGEAGVDNSADLLRFLSTAAVPPHFADQLPLYVNLVYADPTLTDAHVPSFFKDATFGVKAAAVARVEHPEAGLTIVRDNYDVPHIYGQTRAELMFGTGFAGAEDRLFLMDVLRHTARAQLSSFVGGSPSNREMDETQWAFAPYTEQDLQSQLAAAAKRYGTAGRQLVMDAQNYVDGVNAYIRAATVNPALMPAEYGASGQVPLPWKPTDVVAVASLIGAIFGKGGGAELKSALALQAFERRFGRASGRRAWVDFREANDSEAPTTVLHRSFPYETGDPFATPGLALPDPGSLSFPPVGSVAASGGAADTASAKGYLSGLGAQLLEALQSPLHASNWELVAARHSATGHSLAVMGPQVGYYVPGILLEEDIHGPGIDARGAAFPGANLYVQLGHGRDYAWSATSATSDNIDTFAEVLCRDAFHYLYKGRCLAMQNLVRVNSWHPSLADSAPTGSETLTAYRTVHGIVFARGTVHGRRVAFVRARSTYFHEADSSLGFSELNDPAFVHDPASFQRAVSKINFVFNWSYVDANHISYYMSGWMPQRARGTSPDFPILGTGRYDWKGYDPATHTASWLPFAMHPHVTDQDYLVSWNNKQAPAWAAADDQWGYGPVHRSQLIEDRIRRDIAHDRKMTIAQLVRAMEEPATEDLRAVLLGQILFKALGKPRSLADRKAIGELKAWVAAGGHRRDLSRDGHDEFTPAIELMDAWWPKLLAAEFKPMLGGAAFNAVEKMTGIGDTSFEGAWYGYLSKDLRRLFGSGSERDPYSRVYCGNLPGRRFSTRTLQRRCRAALASSLAAALKVSAQQLYGGTCPKDPEPACADQNRFTSFSAIRIPPFPYQNRPTFQQVVTLTRRLPR